ncbi:hypothetical protein [Paracoccus aminophilus]|uniref:hypothetical protein n=1 Tax=Paracoccus aminophilus TaxID=34003 RepID=UPI0004174625|nr:hypothetical protein [Paracoccus aminophilus]
MTIHNILAPRAALSQVGALLWGAKPPVPPARDARPVLRWRIDPDSGKLECRWTLRITNRPA